MNALEAPRDRGKTLLELRGNALGTLRERRYVSIVTNI